MSARGWLLAGVLVCAGVGEALAAPTWAVVRPQDCTGAATPVGCCVTGGTSGSTAANSACLAQVNLGTYKLVIATFRQTAGVTTESGTCTMSGWAGTIAKSCCDGAGSGPTCAAGEAAQCLAAGQSASVPALCCSGAATGSCQQYVRTTGTEGCDHSVSSCGAELSNAEFVKLGLIVVDHAFCFPGVRSSSGASTGVGGRTYSLVRNRKDAASQIGTALAIKVWNESSTNPTEAVVGTDTIAPTLLSSGENFTCLLFGR